MIAEKNDVYAEVANSMYKQNSDLTIRQMCEAREEARIHEEYVKKQLEEKDALINELRAELEKARSGN